MTITQVQVKSILTRSSGYLRSVASHSLNPYRGCALGNSLCGVGCYVQHNKWITNRRRWGSFVEVRTNAADVYRRQYESEKRWARATAHSRDNGFVIFLSSSTEPFQPAERKFRITEQVLQAVLELPPDGLILQTHSHRVTDYIDLYQRLADCTDLRIHISIETDRETIPGLPPHASSVAKRMHACRTLKDSGLRVVAAVAPLLPIENPERFFSQLAEVADAVILDHFIGGDGSPTGSRTQRTPLPQLIRNIHPNSVNLGYLSEMTNIAKKHFNGKVGFGCDGFAGKMLPDVDDNSAILRGGRG